MIDSATASKQLQRLSGLDFFPNDEAPLKELRLAVEAADNENVAVTVVDYWIHYQTHSPKPAELRGLVWAENEKLEVIREQDRQEALSQRGAVCPDCHDFGTVESIKGAPIESVCRYCDCHAGQQRKRRGDLDGYRPDAINAARAKLLRLPGSNAALSALLKRTEPPRIFGEEYNGEY